MRMNSDYILGVMREDLRCGLNVEITFIFYAVVEVCRLNPVDVHSQNYTF